MIIRKIYDYLKYPCDNAIKYCAIASLLSLAGTWLLIGVDVPIRTIINHFFPILAKSEDAAIAKMAKIGFVEIVVLAPLIESLFLIALLWLLRKSERALFEICVITGILVGVTHFLTNKVILNGINATWLFFFYALVYLAYSEKGAAIDLSRENTQLLPIVENVKQVNIGSYVRPCYVSIYDNKVDMPRPFKKMSRKYKDIGLLTIIFMHALNNFVAVSIGHLFK